MINPNLKVGKQMQYRLTLFSFGTHIHSLAEKRTSRTSAITDEIPKKHACHSHLVKYILVW